jgi:hypothetical protein
MKNTYLALIFLSIGFIACNNTDSGTTATQAFASQYSKPISIDTANRMITSYLHGINDTVNTEEIRSFVFNASVLRDYLNDTSRGQIENVKFLLAHNLEYIHSGHEGQRPDTNSHALTLIIVGVDASNNYVYTVEGKAMDFCMPCPDACIETGEAASNLLVAH